MIITVNQNSNQVASIEAAEIRRFINKKVIEGTYSLVIDILYCEPTQVSAFVVDVIPSIDNYVEITGVPYVCKLKQVESLIIGRACVRMIVEVIK